MVLKGMKLKKGIHVAAMTDEIRQYNKIAEHPLSVKTENRPFDFDWNIPEKYLSMNLRSFVLKALEREVSRHGEMDADEIEARIERVELELQMYYEHNLHYLLRTVIYIIDTFREKNIVWGVGRGSACSSYILYLIGVHDIDSVMFELDIEDFLR